MTEPIATCPECGGQHIPDHPGGPLYFKHRLTCLLLALEDTRQASDKEGLGFPPYTPRKDPSKQDNPGRPVTPTERLLLEHLGYTVPEDAICVVGWITPGVRSRTFPTAVKASA